MLVLTRKLDERIRLAVPGFPPIWITLVDVDRGKVRIGIEAARDVDIAREEVLPAAKQYRNDPPRREQPCQQPQPLQSPRLLTDNSAVSPKP